jgi:pimeloyl-ACP methyl ester carboxylesterase
LVLCAASALSSVAAQSPAGGPKAQKKLELMVREALELDVRRGDGIARLDALLPTLFAVTLDAKARTHYGKVIADGWSKGRKLQTSGDHLFFAADNSTGAAARGRYLVGGETKKPKGLAIAMHGGGVGSADAGGAFSAYEAAVRQLGYVIVAPECLEATEYGWTDAGTEEFVIDLVDAALRTWKIDPDRVVFVGHSMGGYGSWALGAHHADRLAAIAPSAGAPTPIYSRKGGPIIDVQDGVIPSLRNVFVAAYQSTDDPQVPPEPNQFAIKKLKDAAAKWGGFLHDYWEVTGQGHGAPPGGHEAHLARIRDCVRAPVPERIVWQPVLSWKRQFSWLYWEAPKQKAVVQADLDRADNSVSITSTRDTKGLYVLLDERVLDLQKDVVVRVGGTEVFRGRAVPDLGTFVLTSLQPDKALQFCARVPAFAK